MAHAARLWGHRACLKNNSMNLEKRCYDAMQPQGDFVLTNF
jgi:hypothetical protein